MASKRRGKAAKKTRRKAESAAIARKRSEAARKAAATRKRNATAKARAEIERARKRSEAAKRAAATRKRKAIEREHERERRQRIRFYRDQLEGIMSELVDLAESGGKFWDESREVHANWVEVKEYANQDLDLGDYESLLELISDEFDLDEIGWNIIY